MASSALAHLGLRKGEYFVVSAHREENVDTERNLRDLMETLSGLVEVYGHQVIVSTHPRTRKRLDALGTLATDPRIRFLKPFGFTDYVRLQQDAFCVLSDSGTITEESALLGFPAINLRNAHERPEGMDSGSVVMSGLKRDRVLEAVRVVTAQHSVDQFPSSVVDYRDSNVSLQVLRVVLSYVDYVNRTVWHKGD
jgi:UDP-N-acetylglucosamine 2-epimerase (non-hydrolysing)